MWFKRNQDTPESTDPVAAAVEQPPPVSPEPPPDRPEPPIPPEPEAEGIRVSRTLVMSEPELSAIVGAHPLLADDGIDVELAEHGFGTRVVITAPEQGGLGAGELETILDELAAPQKRPFSNG